MTEPYTDYDRGMQKLFGLFDPGPAPDLRTDPAFAWRVLEALDMIANDRDDVLNALEAFTQKAMAKRHGSTLRDELYTVVCELGRPRPDSQYAGLEAKLAKAVEALRQIDTETFTDAPVASLHEIRRLVRAVLKELEK